MQKAVRDTLIAKAGIEHAKGRDEAKYLGRKPSFTRQQFVTVRSMLVPRHSDFDGLDAAHSSSGRTFGSTRNSMLRATLGCLLMKPARSSVSTIWWTEGGLTRKYCCMSVSAGGRRCRRV